MIRRVLRHFLCALLNLITYSVQSQVYTHLTLTCVFPDPQLFILTFRRCIFFSSLKWAHCNLDSGINHNRQQQQIMKQINWTSESEMSPGYLNVTLKDFALWLPWNVDVVFLLSPEYICSNYTCHWHSTAVMAVFNTVFTRCNTCGITSVSALSIRS